MASNKSKTSHPEANGVSAVAEATTAGAGAEPAQDPASGRKLRGTSLQAAPGVARRTNKTKAKKAAHAKTAANTKDDAASNNQQQAERPGRCRQGAPGGWPAHELPAADPGHGRQGLLDLACR
jgi:hypothetical protein